MRTTIASPLLLALALAACGDRDGGTTLPPRDETPPLLDVLEAPADSVVVAGPVRVRARCREDAAGGCAVEVRLAGARVAQGADSVDALVPLSGHVDRRVRFTVVATSGGGSTTAETAEFRVVSLLWVPVVTTAEHDLLVDASPDRALYMTWHHMRMLDLRTGVDQGVGQGTSLFTPGVNPYGYRREMTLTAAGAILYYGLPSAEKPKGLEEIGGSGTSDLFGYAPVDRGRWVMWWTPATAGVGDVEFGYKLRRDDVLAARLTTSPDSLHVGSADLGEDGTVVFNSRRAGKMQLFLWTPDDVRQITSNPLADALDPIMVGPDVLYTRKAFDAAGTIVYQPVLLSSTGETPLSPPSPTAPGYRANGAWVLLGLPSAFGGTSVRTPAGQLLPAFPGVAGLGIVSIGPAGELLVVSEGRLRISDPPYATSRDIAAAETFDLFHPKWYDGKLYMMTRRTLYRLDLAAAP